MLLGGQAWAGPSYPGEATADAKLDALQAKLGATTPAIANPCVDPNLGAEPCQRRALDRTFAALKAKNRPFRAIHFGDSHVAADYITGYIRDRLQAKYGDSGRGFTHPDQPWGFGGRRLKRGDEGWERDSIVLSAAKAGQPYGFSAISLEAKKKGARVIYRIDPSDKKIRIYYQAVPKGDLLELKLEGQSLGTVDTAADKPESRIAEFAIPSESEVPVAQKPQKKRKPGDGKGPEGGRELWLVAGGPNVRFYGIAFENEAPGLIYESIGPVGADAQVYLQLGRTSFEQHLSAHKPDLVLYMLGGNDALKIRKGWTTLDKVRRDHEDLIKLVRKQAPNADCLVWGPMDSGEKKGGKVVSKEMIGEVRDMQRQVAEQHGCAFWDTLEAMGGKGSITRWAGAKVMNQDLIHPSKTAADLLGRLFVESWQAAGAP